MCVRVNVCMRVKACMRVNMCVNLPNDSHLTVSMNMVLAGAQMGQCAVVSQATVWLLILCFNFRTIIVEGLRRAMAACDLFFLYISLCIL